MATGNWTDPKCRANATGKRPDCGSVQFGPMHISSPVNWTCKHYGKQPFLFTALFSCGRNGTRLICIFRSRNCISWSDSVQIMPGPHPTSTKPSRAAMYRVREAQFQFDVCVKWGSASQWTLCCHDNVWQLLHNSPCAFCFLMSSSHQTVLGALASEKLPQAGQLRTPKSPVRG